MPTLAPSGTSSSESPTPIQTSAGSSRAGTAAITSPSGISAGRSLAEWTPISASPVEQRPLDPAHEARLVAHLAVGGHLDQLGPPNSSAT